MGETVRRGRFRVPVDPAQVAQDWARRGFSCGLFIDPPGQAWNDFVHGRNELVTVRDGRLEVTVDGEVLIAEPGDEVFIPRRAVHSVRNLADGTTRWLYGYD